MKSERLGQSIYMPLHEIPKYTNKILPYRIKNALQDFADGIPMAQASAEQNTTISNMGVRLKRARERLHARTSLQALALGWEAGLIITDVAEKSSPITQKQESLDHLALLANGLTETQIACIYGTYLVAITRSLYRVTKQYGVKKPAEALMHALEYGDIQMAETRNGKVFFHQRPWPAA